MSMPIMMNGMDPLQVSQMKKQMKEQALQKHIAGVYGAARDCFVAGFAKQIRVDTPAEEIVRLSIEAAKIFDRIASEDARKYYEEVKKEIENASSSS